MHRSKLRAQVALATAICFASLAALAVRPAAAQDTDACAEPAWTLLSWGGSDCR
jgi:hypothetical protein